ncbi:MAG TPA: DUF4230 domain-containing protein [Firmicutes bacterium]|nr:DUF4230 domain-containing protein [Bacillota bacterium]
MGDENKVAKRKKSMVKAKLIALIAVIVIALGAGLYFGKSLSSESRITKLGFEDMGELATQAAYCTMVEDTEAARDLFGVEIPFTQSRLIYSYDVIVRAGLDFEQIEWSVDEPNKVIEVKLPEIKVLNSELDTESFKLYLEDESIFRRISMEENNDSMIEMEENARRQAVGNGLLDEARANAEAILRSFFAGVYDLEKYEIVFMDK